MPKPPKFGDLRFAKIEPISARISRRESLLRLILGIGRRVMPQALC